MIGLITAIIAGAAMSFQGVMNTRLGDTIGMYESNVFAQGTALVLGVVAWMIMGKGDFSKIGTVSPVYWLGGVLGLLFVQPDGDHIPGGNRVVGPLGLAVDPDGIAPF